MTNPHAQITLRATIVIAALAIIYLRTPSTFTLSQFWGEDIILFETARVLGWAALLETAAGYHLTVQFLVGIIGSYLPWAVVPAFFDYSAVALTLLVVWLVTSPRLDMPSKPVLALAVVIVPMAQEELGAICNIQWVLPIGAFALLFMRRAAGTLTLVGEAVFLGLMSVSGPFSIFLAPMFLWRSLVVEGKAERQRLFILTAVVGLGAGIQIMALQLSAPAYVHPASPYPWTLWINLPFKQIATVFGPAAQLFYGVSGAIVGACCIVIIGFFALRKPFVPQKLAMLFLAGAIVFGGMWKFRASLDTQMESQRYFYLASVFALWLICCIPSTRNLRIVFAGTVVVVGLFLLPTVANTPRITKDLEWAKWSGYIDSGLPVTIPTSPYSWYLEFSAAAQGPLANFAPWLGRPLVPVAHQPASSVCTGDMGFVERIGDAPAWKHADGRWKVEGSAWEVATKKPVQLVVLVDGSDTVVAFGFTGFKVSGLMSSLPETKWVSYFSGTPAKLIRAYGIMDNGRGMCRLAGQQHFPSITQKLVSGTFVEAIEITPANKIAQKFKPAAVLNGLSVQLVGFGRKPSAYAVNWRVTASRGGVQTVIGAGTIDASKAGDWMVADLPLSSTGTYIPDEVEVSFTTPDNVPAPIGLPLFGPGAGDAAPPAEVGDSSAASNGRLGLTLHYAR